MNRRHFLISTAGAFASYSVLGSSHGKGAKFKIRKSLKLGMVKVENASLLEKFQLVKDLGYDGIEVDAPGIDAKDLIVARDKTGLPIHGVVDSMHWKTRFTDPDAKVRAEGVAHLKTAIKTCKAIGGTTVLVVPGRVGKDGDYDTCWARSVPEIKKALPLAEKLGIKIAFENVWNDFLTTAEETLRYIHEFDSELVGAYFDIGNINRYTDKPSSWIPVLGKHIMKLDIKGYSTTKAKEAGDVWKGFGVKIGEGTVDWAQCVKELKKINFNSWATAEVKGGDKARLAEIKGNLDKVLA
ncbi:MAG: sugar phosphate isomerase/epimerase family protein [Puniceicoccaceae bacterium]